MKCSKCGKEYDDSFSFCPFCSEPKPVEQQPVIQEPPPPVTPTAETLPQQQKAAHEGKPISRRFIVTFIVLVILVLGAVPAVIFTVKALTKTDNSGSQIYEAPSPASGETENQGDIMTDSAYNQLQNGVNYQQVVQIAGSDGQKGLETGSEGQPGYRVEYQWNGENGSQIFLVFVDGVLTGKNKI